ncbi:hypothetical protein [Amycolatopsis sp. cmx-4-54]|uniref:hypothetical protein n=1 Tax=Amycolatopsis sp. cmx-4-54 TaxID=2790936 RepID=UPI00397E7AFC
MSVRTHTPDTVEVVAFLDDLDEIKLHAGDPSLGEIVRSAKALQDKALLDLPVPSVATLSRLFTGTAVPKWQTVAVFLRACGIGHQEVEGHWKPRWVRLKGGPEAAVRPGADYVAPTCPTCTTATMPETVVSPEHRSHLAVVPA